jgi:hypothetical protein
MTQETYRFAYDEANAELRDIISQFQQLQARKEQVEQVVKALQVVMDDLSIDLDGPSESAPFLVQPAEEPRPEAIPSYSALSPEAEPEPAFAAESSDPFQRRIDNALRHGLGSRDARILPRALNGLLSRA